MAAIIYSKAQIIERVKKHLANGFPGQDFPITDNEIILYIDAAIPFVMKGIMFENAKLTGLLELPDGWISQYNIVITYQDINTYEWWVTLPQPPLALPTGYDIPNVYITDPVFGRSQNAYPIKAKRQGIRYHLPKPTGLFYRVLGDKMFLQATDNPPLNGYNLVVEMPISRTADKNAAMSLPDDAIQPIFEKCIASVLQRYQIPQDVVQDNLPPGNKTS